METLALNLTKYREDDPFDFLYREHATPLFRYAYALTGSTQDAEDIAAEVLGKAFARWRHSTPAQPGGYLRQMVTNVVIDRHRRNRRWTTRLPLVATKEHVASHTDRVDEQTVVIDALQHLLPRQRAAIVLRYWQGASDAQIAEEIGVALGSVGSLIHRGLATLRLELNEEQNNGAF